MTYKMERAYAEVDEILQYLPSKYIEKIPYKLRRLFKDSRQRVNNISINSQQSIEMQNIAYETRVILTILKLYYWCESEDEKTAIKKKLIENERKLKEKYKIFS